MRKSALAFVLIAAAGCGGASKSSGPETLDVTLPSWTVAPGQDMLKCVYQKLTNTDYVYVDRLDMQQAAGGHHIVGFSTTTSQPDGTEVDCNSSQSMMTFRPFIVGMDKQGFRLPDGYAVRVPPHAQIVWQVHYINASGQPITTADHLTFHFVPKTPSLTLVQTFAATKVGFDVPAGTIGSDGVDCIAPQDMNVFLMFGHMHQWGKRITVEIGPTASTTAPFYDISNWNAEMRDVPPHQDWPFSAPFVIHQGDHVRLTCNWDATQEATDLTFPREMCVSLFWFYPGNDSLICSD